jgi:hypothetical protein
LRAEQLAGDKACSALETHELGRVVLAENVPLALQRLHEVIRQFRKHLQQFNKERLEQCDQQRRRIETQVKLGLWKHQIFPNPKEAFEHLAHEPGLDKDLHFAGPEAPADGPRMRFHSPEWIDCLGFAPLIGEHEHDAYRDSYFGTVSEFYVLSWLDLWLVKLLVDVEWLARRFAQAENELLGTAGSTWRDSVEQAEDGDECKASVAGGDLRSDGALQDTVSAGVRTQIQLADRFGEEQARVVEVMESCQLLHGIKDMILDIIRQRDKFEEAIELARLRHIDAVRRAHFKGVF